MITDKFKDTVNRGDNETIKIMLKNSLMMDLSFKQFESMLAYALPHVPNLIEVHDGTVFETAQNWTKDYASDIKSDLVDNFSSERIAHIKEVQKTVYADELGIQLQRQREAVAGSENQRYEAGQHSLGGLPVAVLIASIGVASASILLGVLKGWAIATTASTAVVATIVAGGITYYIVKKAG